MSTVLFVSISSGQLGGKVFLFFITALGLILNDVVPQRP